CTPFRSFVCAPPHLTVVGFENLRGHFAGAEGEVSEPLAFPPIQGAVSRPDPQTAGARALPQREYEVAAQAISRGEWADSSVLVPVQALAQGADPQRAVTRFQDCGGIRRGKPFGCTDHSDAPGAQAVQAASRCAHP